MMRDLGRGELAKKSLSLGVGTAIGQGLVVLASPLWSRLYDPPDLGRVGLFVSFLSVASVAAALRYDLAIPLGKREDESTEILLLSLILILPMSILCGTVLALLSAFNVLGFGELGSEAGIFASILLAATGIFTALRFWHVGAGNFSTISRALIFQGAGRACVPILLAPLHLGWLGLIAGEFAGRTLGLKRLSSAVLRPLMEATRRVSLPAMWAAMRAYRQFPFVFLPSAILDAVAAAIALPVFVMLYGVAAGGQFMLAQQIVLAPAALLCASLADVYHQHIITIVRADPHALTRKLVASAWRLLILAIAVLLPVGLAAPYFASNVFGSQWTDAGVLVAILAPSTALSVAVGSLSRAFVVSRVPEVKLIADIAKIALPVLGMAAGHHVFGSAFAAAVGYSAMFGVSYAIYFAVIVYAVHPKRQVQAFS